MTKLLNYLAICLLAIQVSGQAEKPGTSSYVLGENDQILVRSMLVKEVGEKVYRLDERGDINLPMVGRVSAAGKTILALEAELNEQFKGFYVEPQIAVSMAEYRSAPISILGAVGNPGVHQARGKPSLLEMLSAAGGIRADAGPVVKITRQRKFGPIPLANVKENSVDSTVAEVSVKSLVDARDPSENITVQPYDVISIPRAELVYVLGNVKKAGAVNLGAQRSLSVVEALAMAEGFDPRASPKHARILRPPGTGQTVSSSKLIGGRTEIPVDLHKVLKGQAADVYLEPNDILFVPSSTARTVTTRSLETALQVGTGLVIFRR